MDLKNFFVCAPNSKLGNDNIISAQRPGLKTGMDFRGLVWIICLVEILKLNHEMIVWKIVLPDYLAGVCHYARPNIGCGIFQDELHYLARWYNSA